MDKSKPPDELERWVEEKLPGRMMALAHRSEGPNLGFSEENWVDVVAQFSIWLKENPAASRKERASRLARIILTQRGLSANSQDPGWSKLNQELEDMLEQIAVQLEQAPALAVLVDEVSDWSLQVQKP